MSRLSMNKGVWVRFWSLKHSNIRHSTLVSRLDCIAERRVPATLWYRFANATRAIRPGVDTACWEKLYRLLTKSFDFVFCTSDELKNIDLFDGPVVVDDDDPIFTDEHINDLNRSNVRLVITTTDLLQQRLLASGLRNRCIVIPSGIDRVVPFGQWRTEVRRSFDCPETAPVAGFAAPQLFTDADLGKDAGEQQLRSISYLTRAMEIVWAHNPAFELWLIGRPSASVKAYAQVRPTVRLLGYVRHSLLPMYYSALDMGLYPRLMDVGGRQSIKLLEYMACGLPIVATDVAEALPVKEANAGTVCGTVEQFAVNMLLLARERTLLRELGENGQRYAMNYTWDSILCRYQDALRAISL